MNSTIETTKKQNKNFKKRIQKKLEKQTEKEKKLNCSQFDTQVSLDQKQPSQTSQLPISHLILNTQKKIDSKQEKLNQNKNNPETENSNTNTKNNKEIKIQKEIQADQEQIRKNKNRKREERRKRKRKEKTYAELSMRELKRLIGKDRFNELSKKNIKNKNQKSEEGLQWNIQNMNMIKQKELELQNESYLQLNRSSPILFPPFYQHQLIPQQIFNYYSYPIQDLYHQVTPQIQFQIPFQANHNFFDEDQSKLQTLSEEEENVQKEKRFSQYREKLLNLQKEKKQRESLFSRIETFRAGTFRYIRNKYYQPDEKLAYEEAERDYTLKKSEMVTNSLMQLQIRQQQVEQLKVLRQPSVKFFKQFQPIFPFMYLNIDKGQELGLKKQLFLCGKHIYEPERNFQDNNQINLSMLPIKNPELIHSKLQFKIGVRKNLLLNYEESRTEEIEKQKQIMNSNLKKGNDFFVNYLFNLDFTNVKKIWIWREPIKQINNSQEQLQKIQLTLMIQFKKPCQAIKIEPELFDEEILRNPVANNHTSNFEQKNEAQENQENNLISKKKLKLQQIRSPFNMVNNLEDDINFEKLVYNQNHKQVWENNIGLSRKRAEYGTLLNYWNNQQVLFFEGESTQSVLDTFIESLKKINSFVKIYNHKHAPDSSNSLFPAKDQKLLPIQIKDFTQMTKEIYEMRDQALNFSYQLNKMMPCIRYAFMALLSQKKVNIFNTGLVKFMQKINNGGWSKTQAQADFCSYLIDQINLFEDLDFREDNEEQLQMLFEKLTKSKLVLEEYKIQKNSQNSIFQRRCLVTPTILYFTVARQEESNKVLRQNRANVSRFIRVSFVSEQLDKGFYQNDFYHLYLGYIHSFLKNGFFVGNSCKQVFLNYSNSQLKNHTCWFLSIQPPNLFPQTQCLTVEQIIKDQGDFDEEKNILKRYARRGQCFSTTKNIQMLSPSQICFNYPDIERNGYCFSDGCGWIHPELAKQISVKYNLSNISAFQIRLGGAKGILAINENLELFKSQTQNEAYKVLLRKSQIKFSSKNLSLDVVRCATFSQGYLNRQVILLLHCLGVPTEYFLKKQEQAKQLLKLQDNLEKIDLKIKKIRQKFGTVLTQDFDDQFQIINGQVVDLNEQQKLEFTMQKNHQLQGLANQIKLAVEPCRTFQGHFRQALIKGMEVLKEPTFSNIMHCMQLNQMLNLKKKARIILPDSCVLIGIIDPTGLLEENQIFFQTRKDSFSVKKYKKEQDQRQMVQAEILNNIESIQQIVQGRVLVTRNPCNHPGDIRLLKAVDCLELRHLFNVIVFSSKGNRPQPSMMSGGDLDGDTYLIMWEKELINYIDPQKIFEPADYSKSDLIKEKPVSDDLADYFVFYLQRDVLGIVSNLWLLLADMNGQDGPKNPECVALAQMCSVAVDFAKHGECVSAENFKKQQTLVVKHHPDFLERPDQFGLTTINSNGVLGKLYRESCSQEALTEFFRKDYQNSILYEYELDQKILGLAPEFIQKPYEQLGYTSEDNQQVNQRQKMHFYLHIMHEQIVLPMTQHLKRIMITFQLASEGELFAADLKFRLCHISNQQVFFGQEDKQIYLGDTGSKTEDAIKNLNNQRNKVVEKYSNKFQEIVSKFEKEDNKILINLSVALYLATYFDGNKSGLKYYQKMKDDHNFESFLLQKNRLQEKTTQDLVDLQKKLQENFNFFQIFSAESEQGDLKKLRQLLDCKKIFSIPWLIAGEIILKYYPDNYESQEYLNEQFQMKPKLQRPAKLIPATTLSRQKIFCQQINNLSEDQYLSSIFGNSYLQNEKPIQPNFQEKNETQVNKLIQPPRLELKQQTFLDLIYQTFDQYHNQKIKELQGMS